MISSADNKPIVGVSVYVEGTTVGATSDINGNYTLKVPAGTKHVTFAFLGYDTKKIAVADVELFKLVTLIEASNVMDDVVVVAFGTQKKESLVGAVQVVRPSTLKVTSSNLSTSFAGKIAGVISTQSSGEPGADGANFWIRGISTFGANKSPLLILDGVEIVSEMLNNIPPEAIESFSILRDATATALYGSRGRQRRNDHYHQKRPPVGEDGDQRSSRIGHFDADARAGHRRRRDLHGKLQRGAAHPHPGGRNLCAALFGREDHGHAQPAQSLRLSRQ